MEYEVLQKVGQGAYEEQEKRKGIEYYERCLETYIQSELRKQKKRSKHGCREVSIWIFNLNKRILA